ncbi:unnamed protein product [Rhodiola kirilowii]
MGSHGTYAESTRASVELISLPIQQSDERLVRSIKEKMENVSLSRCIFRIGNKPNQENDDNSTFVPKLISIGPYHYANESLKVLEEHKWKYSFALLSRKPNLEARLDKCVKGLRELEHRARLCYAEADGLHLTSEKFVEMMLIDGCFIIELFIRYGVKILRRRGDPFFGQPGRISRLRLDMIMLENQIPFFVLQMLFSLAPIPEQCTQSLDELALRFFKPIIPWDNVDIRDKFSQHRYHFLDMILDHLLPVSTKFAPKVTGSLSSSKMIKSATNLEQSGISLKENTKHSNTLLDIEFAKGVLAIPHLKIQKQTEALLKNLIGFEQCCSSIGGSAPCITSYAILMHHLICSEKDVELLEKKGIVGNYAADRKAVVDMFKRSVCSGIDLKENLYAELCEQLNGYKRKTWFQLRRSMFKNKVSLD